MLEKARGQGRSGAGSARLETLPKDTDCNNVKSKEELTLYKEYKKDLTNYRLYCARIHCTQHIWL